MEISPLFITAILAFSSLFTIVNPFSTASIFIVISKGASKEKRRQMARKASITAFFVLIIFAVAGNYIMSFFGITIYAFMVAGGIVISRIGLDMVNARRDRLHTEDERKEAIEKDDISITPLAIPMLSGPGAITTSIVLMGNSTRIVEKGLVLLAIMVVCILSYLILWKSDIIIDRIGKTGKNIISRIMGLIVLVVGVQFVINGVVEIMKNVLAG